MKDKGGSAFPLVYDKNTLNAEGMTLRDYFAGQIISQYVNKINTIDSMYIYIEQAYEIADAMIAERKK